MNRIEFLERLESLLADIPYTERREALNYYTEYFEDAEKDDEEVIRTLGSPEEVAHNIREELEGKDILETIEGAKDLEAELMKEVMARKHEHEDHHHHDHEEEEHDHHHHDHEEEGHDHHHHDHDGHHHHHHADEIFTSWGIETPLSYTQNEIEERLQKLAQEEEYGIVLRAKGMVPAGDGTWVYFDYVPEECDIRGGKPDVTGKICVISSVSKIGSSPLSGSYHKHCKGIRKG